ncbi:hypothetical protein [Marinobacter sp. M1C]|nr:hypothetical protein [Marinobacter sp. M1C]UQG67859.1 hypothetical protein MIH19_15230 [Marinobacter sp. M1C]
MSSSVIQLAGTSASIFTAWQEIKKGSFAASEAVKSAGSKRSTERR